MVFYQLERDMQFHLILIQIFCTNIWDILKFSVKFKFTETIFYKKEVQAYYDILNIYLFLILTSSNKNSFELTLLHMNKLLITNKWFLILTSVKKSSFELNYVIIYLILILIMCKLSYLLLELL